MNAFIEDIYYTYADYLSWDDGVRHELIYGEPYAMASPLQVHQEVSREISLLIGNFLKGKPCKMIVAPFDVRLNADTDDDISRSAGFDRRLRRKKARRQKLRRRAGYGG